MISQDDWNMNKKDEDFNNPYPKLKKRVYCAIAPIHSPYYINSET